MARRLLQIVTSAYRATIEEQDDTVLWLTHALKGAGADLSVLLRGNAVSYAVKGQDAAGLSFGGRAQTQPPRLAQDVASLAAKGVPVFLLEEDAHERGIEVTQLLEEVQLVSRRALPALFDRFDRVWAW